MTFYIGRIGRTLDNSNIFWPIVTFGLKNSVVLITHFFIAAQFEAIIFPLAVHQTVFCHTEENHLPAPDFPAHPLSAILHAGAIPHPCLSTGPCRLVVEKTKEAVVLATLLIIITATKSGVSLRQTSFTDLKFAFCPAILAFCSAGPP